MSSAHGPTQSSIPSPSTSGKSRGASTGLLAIGFVLLILALIMFLYVRFYRPAQKQFVYEGRIERTPPTGPVERASGSQPSPAQKQKGGTQEPVSKGGSPNNHSSSVPLELVQTQSQNGSGSGAASHSAVRSSFFSSVTQTAIPVSSPETSASPTPTPGPTTRQTPEPPKKAEKKNILRRFFSWLAGIFKGRESGGNALPDRPPVNLSVKLAAGPTTIKTCQLTLVRLVSRVRSVYSAPLRYKWTASGGILTGKGANTTWDLTGAPPGVYQASVEVDDGRGEPDSVAVSAVSVTVMGCPPPAVCPNVDVSCPDAASGNTPVRFTATIIGGSPGITPTYNWTVSAGKIISGQGTPSIAVDAQGLVGQTIRANVDVGGFGTPCPSNCATAISSTAAIHSSLFGRVRSANGVGISGAVVVAFDERGGSFSAISGSNGDFEIQQIPPGRYRVEISVAGFGKQILSNVGVSVIQTSLLEVTMGPQATPTPPPPGTPSPTPGATATPTPQATPSPTPAKKVREQDQIKVNYPERFLKDAEGEVTFELERVLREVVSSQTNIDGKVEFVAKPGPIPGATPDVPMFVSFGDKYDAYATVRLVPTGLSITSSPANLEQSLTEPLVKWAWRLKPNSDVGNEASFRFEVDIVWKAKIPKGLASDTIIRRNVWPNQPLSVKIGPPPSVKAATYGSPVLAAGGVVALGLGGRRRRRLAAGAEEEMDEEVSTSVFAPSQAAAGNSFLVQVFAHLAEQEDALEEIAREADEDARRRVSARLQKTIKRGAVLTFNLAMPGLEIDAPAQSCVWNGTPALVQFGVTVPKDFAPKDILGLVIVCEDTVPVGHLRFKFKIVDPASATVPVPVPGRVGNASRYRQAFISYASQDRDEVLKRVQMLNSLKLKFFQDLLTLEPGDEWEKAIYQYIDECDVFFLFWSKAASESPWVKKEIEYAMRRKGNKEAEVPEIVPVIIEGPPPAKPPPELTFLHFNDKFLYFINATHASNQRN